MTILPAGGRDDGRDRQAEARSGGGERPWIVTLAPREVAANADRVFDDFRAISAEHGMAMSRAEIRRQCWAPMVAKLVGTMATYADGDDTTAARFTERSLCFLAALGFSAPRAGDEIAVEVAADGMVTLRRRPARMLRRNRVVLGNWRRAMEALAPALTQMT